MFRTELLWQNDERWAGTPLGFGPATIKDWGCLMTSLTMVVNGFGFKETPETFNQKMKDIGAFVGAAISPRRIGEAFPGVSVKSSREYETEPAPVQLIDQVLASGNPVIVRVDYSPNPDIQDHWVVLYAKDGDDYLMWDPYRYRGDAPDKPLRLTSRYYHTGKTPAEAITAVMLVEKAGFQPQPQPQPEAQPVKKKSSKAASTGAVIVNPTGDMLALRGAPSVTGPLLRRVNMDTALTSLESREITLKKVGQYDQWLQVQTPEGQQGYVAAWFVSSSESGAPPAAATPATTRAATPAPATRNEPETKTVKVLEDQLALRNQPLVSENSLIKRLSVGSRLTVLDPYGDRKIGVYGQWLKVKDQSGTEGYVAAWYIGR